LTDPSKIYSRQFSLQNQFSTPRYEAKNNAASGTKAGQQVAVKQPSRAPLKLYGNSGKVRSKEPAIRGTKIDITI